MNIEVMARQCISAQCASVVCDVLVNLAAICSGGAAGSDSVARHPRGLKTCESCAAPLLILYQEVENTLGDQARILGPFSPMASTDLGRFRFF